MAKLFGKPARPRSRFSYDRFPKAELLAAPVEDLQRIVKTLIGTAPNEVRLVGRVARHGRAASLAALLPRERLSVDLMQRLRTMVAGAYKTEQVELQEVHDDDGRALLHLTVRSGASAPGRGSRGAGGRAQAHLTHVG